MTITEAQAILGLASEYGSARTRACRSLFTDTSVAEGLALDDAADRAYTALSDAVWAHVS